MTEQFPDASLLEWRPYFARDVNHAVVVHVHLDIAITQEAVELEPIDEANFKSRFERMCQTVVGNDRLKSDPRLIRNGGSSAA